MSTEPTTTPSRSGDAGRPVAAPATTAPGRSAAVPADDDDRLLLDDLDDTFEAFKLLKDGGSDAAADELLAHFGGHGQVESEMLGQMTNRRVLAHPQRFDAAHQVAMRGLEVLDRNGRRSVPVPDLGPLKPLLAYLTSIFTRLIVNNYQSSLADAVYQLYLRRESWAPIGSEEWHLLRKRRSQLDRLIGVYKGRSLGLPTFLVGGAVVSGALGALQAFGDLASRQRLILGIATVLLLMLFLLAAWSILRAAATARRRIKISVEQPMQALWQTVGWAGNPPKDQSRVFAIVAIALTAVAWVVIPVAIVFDLTT